ncbi:DUF2922 family protein [Syntrophomonas wolfei]|uniref:DUF2922 family protein n=1 Tax=Syntrophomonas wolfei TaxID=863 RepID=UPI0023F082C5|nr:DUF2922 family protein [Syntrophomonas wolfei]
MNQTLVLVFLDAEGKERNIRIDDPRADLTPSEVETAMNSIVAKAGAALCSKLLQDYSLTEKDIKRHKDLATTSCPGKDFRFTELKEMITTTQEPVPATNVIYTVQVGAFKNREYADSLKDQLVKQGYTNAFINNVIRK